MAENKYIYIASIDLVDDKTIAWNLATIGSQTEGGQRDERLSLGAIKRGELYGDLQVAWVIKKKDEKYLKLIENTKTSEESGIKELSDLIDDVDKIKTLAIISHNGSESTVDDSSWSGRIAGLSQQGYPLAHALRLAKWIDFNATAPQLGEEQKCIGLVAYPKPIEKDGASKELVGETKANAGADVEFTDVEFTMKGEGADFIYRVNIIPFTSIRPNDEGKTSEKRNAHFVELLLTQFEAADFTNWRSTLPIKLGEFMDLGWFWSLDIINKKKLGENEKESITNKLKNSPIVTKWDSLVPPQPLVEKLGDRLDLDDSRREFLERCIIGTSYYLCPQLAFLHDHADLGLRPPLQSWPDSKHPLQGARDMETRADREINSAKNDKNVAQKSRSEAERLINEAVGAKNAANAKKLILQQQLQASNLKKAEKEALDEELKKVLKEVVAAEEVEKTQDAVKTTAQKIIVDAENVIGKWTRNESAEEGDLHQAKTDLLRGSPAHILFSALISAEHEAGVLPGSEDSALDFLAKRFHNVNEIANYHQHIPGGLSAEKEILWWSKLLLETILEVQADPQHGLTQISCSF